MATAKATPALVVSALAATDWQAIDAPSDADIARNVAHDPDAPPMLTGGETTAAIVRTVRKRLGLSQVGFAARFHVPVGTPRHWEQNRPQAGRPSPRPPARYRPRQRHGGAGAGCCVRESAHACAGI